MTERVKRSDILRRSLLLAFVAAVGPGGPVLAKKTPRPKFETLEVVTASGTKAFKVEVVDNDASRERGLMFRARLAPDHGMLFDFKAVKPVAFWMRNTLIPLDMVFIANNGEIIGIARNARPFDETPISSPGPVLAVLEIAGGRAAELGMWPGDKVRHRIFKGG